MSRPHTARSHEKGKSPNDAANIDTALVDAVEDWLIRNNSRDKAGRVLLRKKKPTDRALLVQIARNLDLMLREIPRGSLAKVLEASGFGDGRGEVHGFRGNIAIPHHLIDVEDKHLRRLTPVIQRYINVALQIESDRSRALSRLFGGTSFDKGRSSSSDRDWADRLADAITAMAARISVQTEVGPLFDRLSRENLCVAEDFGADGMLDNYRTPELRVTAWLSETFHKTDFSGSNPREVHWFFDRTGEGTPLCGAALFCPKVCVVQAEHERTIELVGSAEPAPASLRTLVRDYLALVPIAKTLESPARVVPWLFRRPEASIRVGNAATHRVTGLARREGGTVQVMYDGGGQEYDTAVLTLPEGSWASLAAELLVTTEPQVPASIDLDGSWQARPATAEHLRLSMSEQLVEGVEINQLVSQAQFGDLSRVAKWSDETEAIDWNNVEPGIFAPWHSAAASMQNALHTGELAERLTEAVDRLAAGHRELHHRLITGCPIAEAMLRHG